MISTSIEDLSSVIRYTPIKVSVDASANTAILLALLNHIKINDPSRSLRLKLHWALSTASNLNQSSAASCSYLLSYIHNFDSKNLLKSIQDESFTKSLQISSSALSEHLFTQTNFQDPLEAFSCYFEVLIELNDSNISLNFGPPRPPPLKLIKSNNIYYCLFIKPNHLSSLSFLMTKLNCISRRKQEKFNKILQENNLNQSIENPCKHPAQKLKTFCGKMHCSQCLFDNLIGKDWENTRCPCGKRISCKNFDEINKTFGVRNIVKFAEGYKFR